MKLKGNRLWNIRNATGSAENKLISRNIDNRQADRLADRQTGSFTRTNCKMKQVQVQVLLICKYISTKIWVKRKPAELIKYKKLKKMMTCNKIEISLKAYSFIRFYNRLQRILLKAKQPSYFSSIIVSGQAAVMKVLESLTE